MTDSQASAAAARVAAAAYGAGFRADALVTAVAVALAESGGRADAIGDKDLPHRGCRSYGYWQINSCPDRDRGDPVRRGSSPTDLLDESTNAAAAWSISRRGTSWAPWTTYRTGAYRRHLDAARAAAEAVTTTGGRPPVASLVQPPVPPILITPSAPAIGSVADGLAPVFAALSSWDWWRRVLYVLLALILFAAGAAAVGGSIALRKVAPDAPPDTPDPDNPSAGPGVGAA